MKLAITAVLTSFAPSLVFGLVGNDWNFTTAPDTGLSDITFPFNIAEAPHVSGFYFAQQFNFHGIPDVGYTGLQPREDDNGKSIVHAAFSSFQKGTTTNHPNCHTGADGGPGVSCAVDIDGPYCHTYNLVVENIGGTTWRGTLVDSVTKAATEIGNWTLPAEAGLIVNGQLGFVEYYNWNDGKTHNCTDLPETKAIFYNPTSTSASGGSITSVYEYGDCKGKSGFSLEKLDDDEGYDIEVGFDQETA
jgi:hypothetical protein